MILNIGLHHDADRVGWGSRSKPGISDVMRYKCCILAIARNKRVLLLLIPIFQTLSLQETYVTFLPA